MFLSSFYSEIILTIIFIFIFYAQQISLFDIYVKKVENSFTLTLLSLVIILISNIIIRITIIHILF
jgi:hypothetical protein